MSSSDPRSSNTLANIWNWFVRISEEPTLQDRNVQLGVHFEEVAEMLQEMRGVDKEADTKILAAYCGVHALANFLKENSSECLLTIPNRKAFLDSICDQLVTATGVAQRYELGVIGDIDHVDQSNWSKFDENGQPYRNQQGKVTKGPKYWEPDLTPFV